MNYDLGDDGFFGYQCFDQYWQEPNRFPYIIHCNKKIAGLVLLIKGSPVTDDPEVWDISEFFIMKNYRRQGVGTQVVHDLWRRFPGDWQVRVLPENHAACEFWSNVIKTYTHDQAEKNQVKVNSDDWVTTSYDRLSAQAKFSPVSRYQK